MIHICNPHFTTKSILSFLTSDLITTHFSDSKLKAYLIQIRYGWHKKSTTAILFPPEKGCLMVLNVVNLWNTTVVYDITKQINQPFLFCNPVLLTS
jgi:hypothetical protein